MNEAITSFLQKVLQDANFRDESRSHPEEAVACLTVSPAERDALLDYLRQPEENRMSIIIPADFFWF